MFVQKRKQLIRGCSEHVADGLGCAADYQANYETIVAPFDINLSFFGDEKHPGGWWVNMQRDNGDKIQVAHLSKYLALSGFHKKGTPVAISGNSGTRTSGPHQHTQLIDRNGKRMDPEKYDWRDDKLKVLWTDDFIKDKVPSTDILKSAEQFFEGNVQFVQSGEWHILCEFQRQNPRGGFAYTENHFKEHGHWKIGIKVSDEAFEFPSGNHATLWSYQQILIHEILHILYESAGLPDIHDHYNRGVDDNQKVWEEFQKKVDLPFNSLIQSNKNMYVDQELLNKLYELGFKRMPDEDGEGYLGKSIKQVLDEMIASDEHEYYRPLYLAAKEIENWGRK